MNEEQIHNAWCLFWGREASFRERADSTGAMEKAFKAGYAAAEKAIGTVDISDGSPLVTELIWEVDRAVKQAAREGGRYDTTICHILAKYIPVRAPVVVGLHCATEGCANPATVHFERGGIGSWHCQPCYTKIQALAKGHE